jgi:hypothetical protein
MDPITPEQAAEAVQHQAAHGGEIELYLCEDQPDGTFGPDGTPLVGFCFGLSGQPGYSGHGLGHPLTRELETEAFAVTDWLAFFRKAVAS